MLPLPMSPMVVMARGTAGSGGFFRPRAGGGGCRSGERRRPARPARGGGFPGMEPGARAGRCGGGGRRGVVCGGWLGRGLPLGGDHTVWWLGGRGGMSIVHPGVEEYRLNVSAWIVRFDY